MFRFHVGWKGPSLKPWARVHAMRCISLARNKADIKKCGEILDYQAHCARVGDSALKSQAPDGGEP
jgi:hypothetical protein